MAYSQIADDDVLRSVAFGGISGTYTKLGAPLANLARLLVFKNLTDGDLLITHTNGDTPASDGTADKLIMAANGFEVRDITANTVVQPLSILAYQKGRQFWVRQSTAPTVKAMYLEVMFGAGET